MSRSCRISASPSLNPSRRSERSAGALADDAPAQTAMTMKRIDTAVAALMAVLAAVVLIGTWDLPFWAEFSPGQAFVPVGVALAGAVLAGLLALEARARPASDVADLPDRGGAIRVVLVAAGLGLFLAAAPWLGFVAGAAVFVFVVLVGVLRRPLLASLFATGLTTALIQGVFVLWLGIPLPKGLIGL